MIDATTIIEYSFDDFKGGIEEITRNIQESGWTPDYIVGVVRGGAIPAVYLSHKLKVPVQMLHWSSRDSGLVNNETNCWIAEDIVAGKKILLVDDIVDGGDTMKQIFEDWQLSVREPLNTENVKIAALYYNIAQRVIVDFFHRTINRDNDPRWIVFDWET